MAGYAKKIFTHTSDFTQILSYGFLRINGGNLFAKACNKVLGIAAVECPFRVRRKGERAQTGTTLVVTGMPADEPVDGLPVGGRYILYILNPLVSSFDLKEVMPAAVMSGILFIRFRSLRERRNLFFWITFSSPSIKV